MSGNQQPERRLGRRRVDDQARRAALPHIRWPGAIEHRAYAMGAYVGTSPLGPFQPAGAQPDPPDDGSGLVTGHVARLDRQGPRRPVVGLLHDCGGRGARLRAARGHGPRGVRRPGCS
ncbi:MAG: hypothetical protein MZV63_23590 [Marinilabiliales bacterium]|nr:hypothetical protein [Marinilabiliales bacterium]